MVVLRNIIVKTEGEKAAQRRSLSSIISGSYIWSLEARLYPQ